jgi:hypothetical protein
MFISSINFVSSYNITDDVKRFDGYNESMKRNNEVVDICINLKELNTGEVIDSSKYSYELVIFINEKKSITYTVIIRVPDFVKVDSISPPNISEGVKIYNDINIVNSVSPQNTSDVIDICLNVEKLKAGQVTDSSRYSYELVKSLYQKDSIAYTVNIHIPENEKASKNKRLKVILGFTGGIIGVYFFFLIFMRWLGAEFSDQTWRLLQGWPLLPVAVVICLIIGFFWHCACCPCILRRYLYPELYPEELDKTGASPPDKINSVL